MIRSIVVRMADGQTERPSDRRAIAGWRVLLLQWQPSSQLERLLWRRRRWHNRRIVCGQIPRPLSPCCLAWRGRNGATRKEERKVGSHSHQKPTFPLDNQKNERKRGNPSKRVAAFLVAPSSSSLSCSCSCGINKGGGTGGRFGDCSRFGWIKSPQMSY